MPTLSEELHRLVDTGADDLLESLERANDMLGGPLGARRRTAKEEDEIYKQVRDDPDYWDQLFTKVEAEVGDANTAAITLQAQAAFMENKLQKSREREQDNNAA